MQLMRKTLLALSENKAVYRFIVNHAFSRKMSRRFIAGEELNEAMEAIKVLNQKGFNATFDHLGENVNSVAEAKESTNVYLDLLERIHLSKIQSNVSLKLSELGIDIDEKLCEQNLLTILKKAKLFDNFIRIDMEGSTYTDRTLALFHNIYGKYENVGVVIQAYLYRSAKDVELLIEKGVNVRLCKGAYNEPASIAFPKKLEVDANYVLLMIKLLMNGNYLAIATHDSNIVQEAKKIIKENKIPKDRFEFQMLYGIRRDLQESLVKEGFKVRIYVPYGKKWFPYFMRRLAERPANLFFFVNSFLKG